MQVTKTGAAFFPRPPFWGLIAAAFPRPPPPYQTPLVLPGGAQGDMGPNPSCEFRVSPLTVNLQEEPSSPEPGSTLSSIWASQLVLDSDPPC